MSYTLKYLQETIEIIKKLDPDKIDAIINILKEARIQNGRLFMIGVGGSAANASHAVNDFRKIVGLESYTPTDNVAELTARINDEGWESSFSNWLKASHLNKKDVLFILSVGGGNEKNRVSANIVQALNLGKEVGTKIVGIVGRDGGATAKAADACLIIPTINPETVTTHAEAFQTVIWHLMVSHPDLKVNEMKWESVSGGTF